jgi:ubiquinone/menaquinone biosynthesis C-methylase UbiE
MVNQAKKIYLDILEAKKAYQEGRNITELLRKQKDISFNDSEIIETAYDLQAGSYIQDYIRRPEQPTLYAEELASILDEYIEPEDSLLDIGTGELTTLSLVVNNLTQIPSAIYAFDISWSRLYKGMQFAEGMMGDRFTLLNLFVADIGGVPLMDKSISITTSSHALEPNGKNLINLMTELFRITIKRLVLFEPCYEINSEEGKKRMDSLGYIKDVEGVVKSLGGEVESKNIIKNGDNGLNPTVCFVIKPPADFNLGNKMIPQQRAVFSIPGTNIPLKRVDGCYFSELTGLCYPILKNIPILKSGAAILASSFDS